MFPSSAGAPAAGVRREERTRPRDIQPVVSNRGPTDGPTSAAAATRLGPPSALLLAGRSAPLHSPADEEHAAGDARGSSSATGSSHRRSDRTPSPAARSYRPASSRASRPHHSPSPSPSRNTPAASVPAANGNHQPQSVAVQIDEQKFERWRQGLERYVGLANQQQQQREDQPYTQDPQAPARPPTAKPTTAGTSQSATRAAPSSLAKSALASLHKKVRTAAPTTAATTATKHTQPPNPRAFERLSHGLPAHDPHAPPQPASHPLRSSLEDMEAAFLTRLSQWAAFEPPAADATGPKSAPREVRSPQRRRGGTRPSAAAAPPADASSVTSEEDAIRARARQLQVDLANLAHRKRASQLAEAAASLRMQMRRQVEEREAALRSHMSDRVQQARESREAALDGCTRLQRDLADKIAALERMQEQVRQRAREVELGYESVMEELAREHSSDVDALYRQATHDMEARLHLLTQHMHAAADAAADPNRLLVPSAQPAAEATAPAPTDQAAAPAGIDTPWGLHEARRLPAPSQPPAAAAPDHE